MKFQRRKSKVLDAAQRYDNGDLMYPRFYIKAVTGHYSIYHRLTHMYLDSVTSEAELVEVMVELESMAEDELWRYLGKNSHVLTSAITMFKVKTATTDEGESWFRGAWSNYTTKFYEAHPELFNECDKIPVEIINKIRMEISEKQKQERERHIREIERKEEEYRTGKVLPTFTRPPVEVTSGAVEEEGEKPKPKAIVRKKKETPSPVDEKPKKKILLPKFKR